jgi:hypothetical protein
VFFGSKKEIKQKENKKNDMYREKTKNPEAL